MSNGEILVTNFCTDESGEMYPVKTGEHFETGEKPTISYEQSKKFATIENEVYQQAKKNLIKITGGNIPSQIKKTMYQSERKFGEPITGQAPIVIVKNGAYNEVARTEAASNKTNIPPLTITLRGFADATNAVPQQNVFYLGDAARCYASLLSVSVAAVPNGTVNNPLYGANVLNILRALSLSNPYKIAKIRVTETLGSQFFGSGKITVARVMPFTENVSKFELSLSEMYIPNQFVANIREFQFNTKPILDSLGFIAITVPAGSEIALSITVEEMSLAYNMQEI